MGKVIYDLFFQWTITWFVVVWFLIAGVMLRRRILGKRFEQKEELYLGPKRRRQVIDLVHENEYRVTSIVPCADEEPEVFRLAMSRLRGQVGLVDHKVIVIIDAVEDPDNPGPLALKLLAIAKEYADLVLVTNVCDKRENIRNGMRAAREHGMLHPLTAVLDSDTVCDHEWVAAFLAYEFTNDPKVGAASSAQRCLRTNTHPERIGDWLEDARLKSSMAAASDRQQVVCVPGRLGMYRTELIEPRLDELADEVWSGYFKPRLPTFHNPWPFTSWRAKCKAGDDRVLTNMVHEAGYGAVLVLPASVKTLVPDNYRKLWKTWRRWGTSSQGYVYRTLFGEKRWLRRREKRFILRLCLEDIFITHISCFMQLAWVYSLFFSRDTLLLPFSVVLAMSIVGVLATFAIRQAAHLRENPRDWVILPLFVVVVGAAQFVRLAAHYSPWNIGVWSTRNVDFKTGATYVRVYARAGRLT